MNKNKLSALSNKKILIAPSILAANFADLGNEIRRVGSAGADIIHIDIMDGHFVPNLTIGPPVVQSLRSVTILPFDVHLMLTNPLSFVKPFAEAGADNITIHVECNDNIDATICEIRKYDCSVGISLRPKTSFEKVLPYLEKVDLVLVMTVEPGFGGQSFMSDMMSKVKAIRQIIKNQALSVHLEVDGGIDNRTASIVAEAGANMLVAGTSVFKNPVGPEKAISNFRLSEKVLFT